MANKPELTDTPATFQLAMWRHFGFPVDIKEDGSRVITKTHIICHLYYMKLVVGGADNTSNMQMHMRRHHPDTELTQPSGAASKKP